MRQRSPGGHPVRSLAWLLEPLSVDNFLDEIWGKDHHHFARDLKATVRHLVRDAIAEVDDSGALDDGVGLLADVLVGRGTCPPVGKIAGANAIDGHTWVVKHQPLYARVKTVANGVTLQFASLSINAGADHEDAMRFVAHSVEPFRVGELPGLRSDQQTDLARTLIVSGFLAPLTESENS